MKITQLLDHPCRWLVDHRSDEIAISSRIRLARNVAGHAFPGTIKADARQRLCRELCAVLSPLPVFSDGVVAGMESLSALERHLLFERNLISHEHAEKGRGSAVAISADEQTMVMVNEEDHLRLQVVEPGLRLHEAWERMLALDDAVERSVEYAFSEEFGYLTACPSNTGTGLRAGVMLHLPATALMDEMAPVIRGLGKIGCAVRGIGGEGSEADGLFYQVSNQVTLGRGERAMLRDLQRVVDELVTHERNARVRIVQERADFLRDRIGRSLGILQNAYVLPSKEALDLLSFVRLGLALGMLESPTPQLVELLLVQVRPAHLQRLAGRPLDAGERDALRAEKVRSGLAELKKTLKLTES